MEARGGSPCCKGISMCSSYIATDIVSLQSELIGLINLVKNVIIMGKKSTPIHGLSVLLKQHMTFIPIVLHCRHSVKSVANQ